MASETLLLDIWKIEIVYMYENVVSLKPLMEIHMWLLDFNKWTLQKQTQNPRPETKAWSTLLLSFVNCCQVGWYVRDVCDKKVDRGLSDNFWECQVISLQSCPNVLLQKQNDTDGKKTSQTFSCYEQWNSSTHALYIWVKQQHGIAKLVLRRTWADWWSNFRSLSKLERYKFSIWINQTHYANFLAGVSVKLLKVSRLWIHFGSDVPINIVTVFKSSLMKLSSLLNTGRRVDPKTFWAFTAAKHKNLCHICLPLPWKSALVQSFYRAKFVRKHC